jgi:hypothetical protein
MTTIACRCFTHADEIPERPALCKHGHESKADCGQRTAKAGGPTRQRSPGRAAAEASGLRLGRPAF